MKKTSPGKPEQLNLVQNIEHLRNLSRILDNSIAIPGTSYRIGIDPILGLIPGIGDYLGAGFSVYIVLQAARLGASKATISRMALNIILETVLGTIPFLGDIFDASWKANLKNMSLLEEHLQIPQTRKRVDMWFIFVIMLAIIIVLIGATAVTIYLLMLIIKTVTG